MHPADDLVTCQVSLTRAYRALRRALAAAEHVGELGLENDCAMLAVESKRVLEAALSAGDRTRPPRPARGELRPC